MLSLHGVSYTHPDRTVLFRDINITINKHDKIALIGNNGAGKSTLIKLLAGVLPVSGGTLKTASKPYYIPQHFGQYNNWTVARSLQIEDKLNALKGILDGQVTEENFALLNDDWTIEEWCAEAFTYWGLGGLDLSQEMSELSGGQKTKVFLAGIMIHEAEIVLMDEPSNHLDVVARKQLYNFITTTNSTVVVVSHDKVLLNLMQTVYELDKHGITIYGGNYDFYVIQKQIDRDALNSDVKSKEKALRKAKEIEREAVERQQKMDARGKKKQTKAGMPTIVMNTLRNNAEKSTSRMKGIHAEKVDGIREDLNELRKELPDADLMKIGFDNAALHKGKMLFAASGINFAYGNEMIWERPLSLNIISGERISIRGKNGSGKTTLIKIMLGVLQPTIGDVRRADNKTIYIDQDYSIIDNGLTVYEQAQSFNTSALLEHEIKIRLDRFLFTETYWDKKCSTLSGGEKMRLILCCITIGNQAPDIIVLDEPTNNLDIQNVEILTKAINKYHGTLIVISHDEYFINQIRIERSLDLDFL